MKSRILFILILLYSFSLIGQPNESPPKEEKPSFKSNQKGNISSEYLATMLLSPEHQNALKSSDLLWFGDIFKIGLHSRTRYESIGNSDFNKKTDDYKSYTTQNSQVWFLADINEYLAVKLTIQDTRVFGGGLSPSKGGDGRYVFTTSIGEEYTITSDPKATTATSTTLGIKNSVDLREAFVMLKNPIPNVNVQVGRQNFSYGQSRIIGARNDSQSGNSFDGMRIMYNSKYFNSHLIGVALTEESAPNGLITHNGRKKGSIDDSYMSSWYNTVKLEDWVEFDFYYVGVYKKWILNNNPTTTQDRLKQRDNLHTGGFSLSNRTAGGRSLPKGKSWDWNIEAAWQWGFTGDRINANWDALKQEWSGKRIYTERVKYDSSFFVAQTGYTFFDSLRIGGQFVYASGDPNRSDSKVSTWNPLMATRSGGFPYFDSGNGLSGLSFWSNVKAYSTHIQYYTRETGRFIFAAYDVRKAKSQDGWYSGAGDRVANSTENFSNDRFNGNAEKMGKRLMLEYDFIYQYLWKDSVSIWFGASLVYGGDSIQYKRNNLLDPKIENRYTFDPSSKYFFFSIQAAI